MAPGARVNPLGDHEEVKSLTSVPQFQAQMRAKHGDIGEIGFTPRGAAQAVGSTVSALTLGASEAPLVGYIARGMGEALRPLGYDPEAGQEHMRANASQLMGTRLYDVLVGGGRLVGEIAPGMGAYSLGAKGAGAIPTLAKLPQIARVAGGALGIGAFSGTERYIETGDLTESLKSAGKSAVFSAAFDAGFLGLGRLLSGRSKDVAPEQIVEMVKSSRNVRQRLGSEIRGRVDEATANLDEFLKTNEQLGALTGAQRQMFEAEGRQLSRVVRQAEAERSAFVSLFGGRGRFDPLNYTSGSPHDPDGARLLAERFLTTPEGLARKLGPTMAQTVREANNAEVEVSILRSATEGKLSQYSHQFADVLGVSPKALRKSPLYTEMFDQVERGGLEAVGPWLQSIGRGSKTTEALAALDDLSKTARGLHERLVSLGAEPALTADDMTRLGVKYFIPHVDEYVGQADLTKRLVAAFGGDEAAVLQAQKYLEKGREGLAQFGSLDRQRLLEGTLRDKVARGIPLAQDPLEAFGFYFQAASRRLAYGQRFGYNGELGDVIKQAAVAEGSSFSHANSIVDVFLAKKYHDQALSRFFQRVTDVETGAKLSFSVIPNVAGWVNSAVFSGFGNTVKAMSNTFLKRNPKAALEAVGVATSLDDLYRHTFTIGGPLERSGVDRVLEGFARGTLKYSGFAATENFNRAVSSTASFYQLRKYLAQALDGRLRGDNYGVAARYFNELGLSLDDLVARGQAVAAQSGRSVGQIGLHEVFHQGRTVNGFPVELGELEVALGRAAGTTQFVPNLVRRPVWANSPGGRVMYQFKNFAVGHARFVRDQVLVEAARGNYRPLARMLAIYPVMGELVGDARSLLTGRDRPDNGISRYLDNVLAVGGLGIASDTMMAARYGRLPEFVMGPGASDALTVFGNLASGNLEGNAKFVEKLPVIRAARMLATAGALTVAGALELIGTINQEEGPEVDEMIGLGEARQMAREANQP